jgi:hypothetical protein
MKLAERYLTVVPKPKYLKSTSSIPLDLYIKPSRSEISSISKDSDEIRIIFDKDNLYAFSVDILHQEAYNTIKSVNYFGIDSQNHIRGLTRVLPDKSLRLTSDSGGYNTEYLKLFGDEGKRFYMDNFTNVDEAYQYLIDHNPIAINHEYILDCKTYLLRVLDNLINTLTPVKTNLPSRAGFITSLINKLK